MTKHLAGNVVMEILLSRRFAIISALLMALFSPLALYATSVDHHQNSSSDSSLTMSILGRNMKFGDYFPSNNHTIMLGEQIDWQIIVHNGLGNAEYLSVRVKLLNSTNVIPNDLLNQPSPERAIFEFQSVVAANSSWAIPLNWTISESSYSPSDFENRSSRMIKSIVLNGKDISDINIESSKGQGFKMVFELWHYDSEVKNFVYELPSESLTDRVGDKNRSVWTQIWFDVMN